MPTIREIAGPYRLFFFSFDCGEPKHVHVQRERKVCKYWMEPVALASSHGFSAVELNAIRQLLETNRTKIWEAWNEHCGVNR
ncbi:MAG: DUF4160 domain-containing protein [Nitrosomonadales bacterium]|nr:DUF4160 domain-containing protein [Nitrosomonadales bacterium]